jgi:predicted dehydrogenase
MEFAMRPPPLPRRRFLRAASLSALSTAALGVGGCRSFRGTGEVRCAVVGLNRRGQTLAQDVLRTPHARLVAICDVDTAVLARAADRLRQDHGIEPDRETDYRRLLERRDLDAVILATPNHWHALQAIWACEAGKDIYLEKPACHSLWEGRQMLAAARRHRRVIEVGFQNRSDLGLREAFPRILAGEIGPITGIRGLCYRQRESIGRLPAPLVPPPTLRYDPWLGPADDEPILRPELHYDWHWDWNTGNGDLGNQGPHELDLIRWILGEPDHPAEIFSFGGRFGWEDAGETPNMLVTTFRWNDIPVLFEVRNLWITPETAAAANFQGRRVGVLISGEGGEFRGGRGGGMFYDREGRKFAECKGDGGYAHFPGFIEAVRSRRLETLACGLETGYRSSVLAQLGNISYRLGGTVGDDTLVRTLAGDPALAEAHGRFREHLAAWDLPASRLRWTLGPRLRFAADREQFTGPHANEANGLLRREGRAPYQIPRYV